MSSQESNDAMSKCAAISYATFLAGFILLVIVSYNYYSDYQSKCMTDCQNAKKACRATCTLNEAKGNLPAGVAASAVVPATAPAAPQVAKFAGGKLTDKQLQERFLNNRPDVDYNDFKTYYVAPNDDDSVPYDPAADSLEPDVYNSHKEFVEDAYISTQGANQDTELDHDVNIVPWVGLKRPENPDIEGSDARTVTSLYNDQMSHYSGSIVI
jgi:hypothetical protein